MRLSKLTKIITAVSAVLLTVLGVSYVSYYNDEQALSENKQTRIQAYQLIDQLRQSSDDLSRLARSFVVSGDASFDDHYQNALAIQKGEQLRPENYQRIYWDLFSAGITPAFIAAEPMALASLIEAGNYSSDEKKLLTLSLQYAARLNSLEIQAMNAAKGLYQDAAGNYNHRGEPDRELAKELMYSAKYHQHKANTMAPLNSAMKLLDQRIATETTTYKEQLFYYNLIITSTLMLLVICIAISMAVVHFNVIRPVRLLRNIFDELAKGNFDIHIPGTKRGDELGDILKSAETFRTTVQEVSAQNWIKSNVAELAETLQEITDIREAANQLVSFVAPKVGAGYAAFFRTVESNEKRKGEIRLYATYAATNRSRLGDKFTFGEGLVGQCAIEKKTIILNNAPDDFVSISSGLGESQPMTVAAFPIIYKEHIIGVLELGSFNDLTDEHIALIDELLPVVSLLLNNMHNNYRSTKLLEQTQSQAEELRASEEELRVSNEELLQKSHILEVKTAELQASEEELRVGNEALRQKTDAIEKQYKELEKARNAAEKNAAKLEEANRYKSEFLANMSHELRTPLNSVLILAKNLAANHQNNLSDDDIESANIIHDSGSHLLHLINDILDISKTEAGAMELVIEDTVIEEVADNVDRYFRHVAEEKQLSLTVDYDVNLPPTLPTDATRLDQILNNLLSNAIKFTQIGGVTVRFDLVPCVSAPALIQQKGSDALCISITDTGIGIAEDKLEHVFEAFKQADGSTSRQFGGTGLGLTITRTFTDLLGGVIEVRSQIDEGTSFMVYLPFAHDQAAIKPIVKVSNHTLHIDEKIIETDESETSTYQTINATSTMSEVVDSVPLSFTDDREQLNDSDNPILIVEDDQVFAKILYGQVKKKGFKCVVATDGEQGMVMAARYHPYGIMLDINLPHIDGWSVLAKLKANIKTKHIPVHIVSAQDNPGADKHQGAVGYLTKPVSPDQVSDALQQITQFAGGKQKKVLVIEDDQASRKAISQTIENDNVSTITVESAEAGLELLDTEDVNCVILDLGLPGMDGFSFLDKVKSRGEQSPPVIIYSGRELSKDENARLRKHTDSIILKGEHSADRLSSEVSLFLHSVHSQLGEQDKKSINKSLALKDKAMSKDKTVLIVDDDMRNSLALSKTLNGHGYKILLAKDGFKAIERLQQNPNTDLILMDIMMPNMDGHEAIRKIRSKEQHSNIPIIVLTAKAMKGERAKSLSAGADDFFTKPIDIDSLIQKMDALLKGESA